MNFFCRDCGVLMMKNSVEGSDNVATFQCWDCYMLDQYMMSWEPDDIVWIDQVADWEGVEAGFAAFKGRFTEGL